jgi:hypothetical protein
MRFDVVSLVDAVATERADPGVGERLEVAREVARGTHA